MRISNYEYREITAVADRILRVSEDQRTLVIAMGRSPTVIAAEIERRGATPVAWLPLSAFRFHPNGMPSDREAQETENLEEHFRELDAEERSRLFAHFERHLAAHPAFKNARRLLILDYSRTADSMVAASHYLAQWLRHRRNQKRVSGIALTHPERVERVSSRIATFSGDLTVISVPAPSILADRLSESFYDPYSPNPYFSLRASLERPSENHNETSNPAHVEELRRGLEVAAGREAQGRWFWSPARAQRSQASIARVVFMDRIMNRKLLAQSTIYIQVTEQGITNLVGTFDVEDPLSLGLGIFAVRPGTSLHDLILTRNLFAPNLMLEVKDIDAQIQFLSASAEPEAIGMRYVLEGAKTQAQTSPQTVTAALDLLPRISNVQSSVSCASNLENIPTAASSKGRRRAR